MLSVLRLFLRHGEWMEDSEEVACTKGQGQCYGRVLCHWIKAFLIDNASLPVTTWGTKMSPALTLNQASRMSFEITSGVLGNTSRHRILLITLTAQRLGGSMVLLFPFQWRQLSVGWNGLVIHGQTPQLVAMWTVMNVMMLSAIARTSFSQHGLPGNPTFEFGTTKTSLTQSRAQALPLGRTSFGSMTNLCLMPMTANNTAGSHMTRQLYLDPKAKVIHSW